MNLTFRHSPRFAKAARWLLSEDDVMDLENALLADPEAGDVIKNSGGLRKIRFAAKGKGKLGGVRVIYLRLVGESIIHLLDCYAKNEKENLSAADLEKLSDESV